MANNEAGGSHFSHKQLSDSRFSRNAKQPKQAATNKQASPYGGYGARYMQPDSDAFVDEEQINFEPSQSGRYAHANIDTRVGAHDVPLKVSAGKRRKGGRIAATILTLLLVAGIGAGAWWLWSHRTVSIQVNGLPTDVRLGSTLDQVLEETGNRYSPGNLVSVSGVLLTEGAGNSYKASIDGQELTEEEKAAYRVTGEETIDFDNGTDKTEDYDVSYREELPLMYIEGEWGSISYISQWGQAGKTEVRTGKISGETVDGEVVQELRHCIVTRTNPVPDNGERLVALTFDDGPSGYTQDYLDILAEHGAKATFFNLGENIADQPGISKAIVDSGNQLCSHTYRHAELPALEPDDLRNELSSTFDAIRDATGLETSIIRPPYGEFSPEAWLNSNGMLSASILWNQDSEDWTLPGADAIVANSLANMQSGSIILMHDGGGNRDQNLEALPRIIEALQADGFKLVTINELLASDSSLANDVASGNARPPEGAAWPTALG